MVWGYWWCCWSKIFSHSGFLASPSTISYSISMQVLTWSRWFVLQSLVRIEWSGCIVNDKLLFRCRSSSSACMPSFHCNAEWVESSWICCRSTMIWLIPRLKCWSIFEYPSSIFEITSSIFNLECCAEMRWVWWIGVVVVASEFSALSNLRVASIELKYSTRSTRKVWHWHVHADRGDCDALLSTTTERKEGKL